MLRGLEAMFVWFGAIAAVAAQPGVEAPPSQQHVLTKLARQIEPTRRGRAERLSQYVDFFRSQLGNDPRLFAFQVEAVATEAGQVLLNGYVEFPETRAGLIGFLEALRFDVLDHGLQTLPDLSLGKKAMGLVQTTHTLSYSRPTEPRSVVTDCLLGERLYLLRQEGEFLLAHSSEGYLGYVAAADVLRVDETEFARYPTESSLRLVVDHRPSGSIALPAGALLKYLSSDSKAFLCELPTGEMVVVPRTAGMPTRQPKDQIERAVAAGTQLLGTPYHWGGKTSDGIDCSGLVQVACATGGIPLPRDSNQQFLLGQLTATRWYRGGLRRGDTLYFLGPYGRIRHTALYLGDDRYLQAEMPAVNIRSLNSAHDDYDERRATSFAFGKRLWP